MLAVLCVGAVGVEEVVVTEAFPPAQAARSKVSAMPMGASV